MLWWVDIFHEFLILMYYCNKYWQIYIYDIYIYGRCWLYLTDLNGYCISRRVSRTRAINPSGRVNPWACNDTWGEENQLCPLLTTDTHMFQLQKLAQLIVWLWLCRFERASKGWLFGWRQTACQGKVWREGRLLRRLSCLLSCKLLPIEMLWVCDDLRCVSVFPLMYTAYIVFMEHSIAFLHCFFWDWCQRMSHCLAYVDPCMHAAQH